MRDMKSLFSMILLFVILLVICLPCAAQTEVGKTPVCNLTALLDNVTANTRVILAPASTPTTIFISGVSTPSTVANKRIRVCHVSYRVKQTSGAANFGLITGTGSACATGSANFTPQWIGTASVIDAQSFAYGADSALVVPAAKDLCLSLSATPTQAQVFISYGIS